MGFDLKKLVRSISKHTQPQINSVISSDETESEIVLPIYEIEEEISVPVKRKKKDTEISRKVPLNPLSD